MYATILSATGIIAMAHAQQRVQDVAPPPVLLNATKSGVLPVLPTETPFTGLETLQGAILNPGPVKPGFTGLGGTAAVQSNMPTATYVANMPDTMYNPAVEALIQGSITAVGSDAGVQVTVNLTGLPDQAQYGPFPYHIHTLPVPEDGNCTATTSHFDPTNRGEYYMCDTSAPETCQVGDLSGKHGGKIMAQGSFQTTFIDPYLSTDPSSPHFFGGLAIVIHSGNTTRLTCANFEMMSGSGNGTSSNATTTMSMPVPSSTMSGTPEQYTGAATKIVAGMGVIAVGFLGIML